MSMPIVATGEFDLLDMAVLLRNPSSVTRWKCRSTTGPFHYRLLGQVTGCKFQRHNSPTETAYSITGE